MAELSERYVRIPSFESRMEFRLMRDFAAAARDPLLREALEDSLHGRGAFRRFKNVLLEHPGERDRWFEYCHAGRRDVARDWLESLHLSPVEPQQSRA